MQVSVGCACPLHANHASEFFQTGQIKARCAGNGCPLGKLRNAGMARLEKFPSGEPLTGHLPVLRSLARERPLLREYALHLPGQRLAEE